MNTSNYNNLDLSWIDRTKITKEVILGNINQEEAFSGLLGTPINIYEKNLNTLRVEQSPSISFMLTPNNRLYATDFGDTSYAGDVIDWTTYYYRDIHNKIITLDEAGELLLSNVDFVDINSRLDEYVFNAKDKTNSIIEVEAKLDNKGYALYDKSDIQFWSKIGINYSNCYLLREFGIFSARKVWISKIINDKKVLTEVFSSNPNYPIFTYYFEPDKFKIYSPYGDKRTKWRTNTDLIDDIGMNKNSDFIVLTKSRKDRLALKLLLDIDSYSFPSENMLPFLLPYKTALVFYDNDYDKPALKNTGLKRGREISSRFNIPYTYIPSKYQCTDISELIEKYGTIFAKKLITDLINNAKINNELKTSK